MARQGAVQRRHHHDIDEALKPGVRESDIVDLATKRLFEMGSDQVEAINAIAGERCSPHPHVFSDRLIRPGDQAYFDHSDVPAGAPYDWLPGGHPTVPGPRG